MDDTINKNMCSWKPKDYAYKAPESNALLVTKLQQKVARLEIALKDKEDALQKLQSSTKASYINELRIQTEMYYQEVMRIRNELNNMAGSREPANLRLDDPSNRRPMKSPQNSEEKDKTLLAASVERLLKENKGLTTKVNTLEKEKEKLTSEIKTFQKPKTKMGRNSSMSKLPTQAAHVPPQRVDGPPSQMEQQAMLDLKTQIEDLRKREKTWEEERTTYLELVNNLKEDRVFYKETNQKRQDEFCLLQNELVKLQKELQDFQSSGQTFCRQCSQHTISPAKTKKHLKGNDETSLSRLPTRFLHRRTLSADGSSPLHTSSKQTANAQKPNLIRRSNSRPPNLPLLPSPTHNSRSTTSPSSPQDKSSQTSLKSSDQKNVNSTSNSRNGLREKPPIPISPKIILKSKPVRPSKDGNMSKHNSLEKNDSPKGKTASLIQNKSTSNSPARVFPVRDDDEVAMELIQHADDDSGRNSPPVDPPPSLNRPSRVSSAEVLKALLLGRSQSSQDRSGSEGVGATEGTPAPTVRASESFLDLIEAHAVRKRKMLEFKSRLKGGQITSSSTSPSTATPSKTDASSSKPNSITAQKIDASIRFSKKSSKSTISKSSAQSSFSRSGSSSTKDSPKKATTRPVDRTRSASFRRRGNDGSESQSEELDALMGLIEGHVIRNRLMNVFKNHSRH